MKSSHPYNLDGRPAPPRCVVWRSSLPADAHAAAVLLDEDDRARCATYARSADRARFVGGRVLARRAVAAELGCDPREVRLDARCAVCGGAHGRPRVLGPGEGLLDLSIAHASERVLVAVARGCAVGVDVERIGPFEDLATAGAGVLAAAERAVLVALPARARRRLLWLLDAQGGAAEGDRPRPRDRAGHRACHAAGRSSGAARRPTAAGPGAGAPARPRRRSGIRGVPRAALRRCPRGRRGCHARGVGRGLIRCGG